MDFIFMLTRDDRTVGDCLELIDLIRPVGLKHIGFKDVAAGTSLGDKVTALSLDLGGRSAELRGVVDRPAGEGVIFSAAAGEKVHDLVDLRAAEQPVDAETVGNAGGRKASLRRRRDDLHV